MSLPKITHRPNRVVKTEYDPYQFYPQSGRLTRRRGTALIHRDTYEDGTSMLFVGSSPVLSIHYGHSSSSDIADSLVLDVILEFQEGYAPVRLSNVYSAERIWLNESIRRSEQ